MLLENNTNNINTPIFNFSLKGTDGKQYSPDDFKDKSVLIIIFMCNHCPYVKAVMQRFIKIQDKFKDRGIQLIGINSNDIDAYPEDSFDNMKLFYAEYGMNFPYLIDETQQIARKYDAVCTPDIFLYNSERILKYRGRLDNNWQDESKVTQKDLENAIEVILEGKEPDKDQKPSMGCSIKWKY